MDYSYPYNSLRTFSPISSLYHLNLNFIRKDLKMSYDFKGRTWYIQIIFKTVEIDKEHESTVDKILGIKETEHSLPQASNYIIYE